jgi:hypothetical protein
MTDLKRLFVNINAFRTKKLVRLSEVGKHVLNIRLSLNATIADLNIRNCNFTKWYVSSSTIGPAVAYGCMRVFCSF